MKKFLSVAFWICLGCVAVNAFMIHLILTVPEFHELKVATFFWPMMISAVGGLINYSASKDKE